MRVATGLFAGLTMAVTLTGCKPDAAVQKAEVIGRGSKDPGNPPVISAQAGMTSREAFCDPQLSSCHISECCFVTLKKTPKSRT